MGKDARQRAARKSAERRVREEQSYRLTGPDLGTLLPCPYCDRPLCNPETCPEDPDVRGNGVLFDPVEWNRRMQARDRLAGVAAGAQGGRDSGLASRFDSGARPPTLFSSEAFAQISGQMPFDSEGDDARG